MIASFFLLLPSMAKKHRGKHGGKTSSVSSVVATVSGNVTLLAKRRGFPSDLAELYAGNDSAVTFSKKGKKINVAGTYTGGDIVAVEEVSSGAASSDTYSFEMPAIASILETFSSTLSKDSEHSGTLFANFAGTISKTMSISNVVTSREGNKGKLSGNFAKGTAQGRFVLNFDFQ